MFNSVLNTLLAYSSYIEVTLQIKDTIQVSVKFNIIFTICIWEQKILVIKKHK